METQLMLIDCKTEYFYNVNTTQSILQIQFNSYLNPSDLFFAEIEKPI